jgi:DNA-binding NarL/FixJ family response regulator
VGKEQATIKTIIIHGERMTRLLYLPDDATIIQIEVDIPSKQLAAAINAGLKPVPQLEESPDRLSARLVGNSVIVFPWRMHENYSKVKQYSNLTRRQREVLELAMNGYSKIQIAERMGISRRTVAYHLKSIKTLIQKGDAAGL